MEILGYTTATRNFFSNGMPHRHIIPTWNYASVQITGRARIIDDPKAIREMLTVLVDTYESAHGNTYSVQSLPEDYYNREVQGLMFRKR